VAGLGPKNLQFRASNWAETLEGLRVGEVDIHSGLSFSKKRAEWIDFSTQIYETFTRIYHRVDDIQPTAIGGYGAFVVGAWFGTYQEAEFRTTYPTVNIRSFGTNQELIEALMKGEVKAIVQEEQLMEAALDRLGLRGDITARPERMFPSTIHAGVFKGNSELLEQINKGLSAIPREKLADLEKRWIPNPENHFYKSETASIVLSPDEKSWLNDHSVIRVGMDPTYPPFEFVNGQGNYSGIIPDYLKLIGERLGIEFKPVHGLTWTQVLEGIKDGTVDMAPGLNDTADRVTQISRWSEKNFPRSKSSRSRV
jgi:polar amino acid transport system substrate-binding protein